MSYDRTSKQTNTTTLFI